MEDQIKFTHVLKTLIQGFNKNLEGIKHRVSCHSLATYVKHVEPQSNWGGQERETGVAETCNTQCNTQVFYGMHCEDGGQKEGANLQVGDPTGLEYLSAARVVEAFFSLQNGLA